MQNLARKAILQVSATDTAALCGTYPQGTRRRYAAYAVNDTVAHDTAMRILLGNIALCAAKHERSIEPIMSVFDGHHTRVSVLVTPGKKNASNVYENLGWRVNEPDSKTIAASIKAEGNKIFLDSYFKFKEKFNLIASTNNYDLIPFEYKQLSLDNIAII